MIVHLLPRSHALATLEVVHVGSCSAGSGADATSSCLDDAGKLLEALAEMLLSHFEVLHAGFVATALASLSHEAQLLRIAEGARVVLQLLCLSHNRFFLALGRHLLLGKGGASQRCAWPLLLLLQLLLLLDSVLSLGNAATFV